MISSLFKHSNLIKLIFFPEQVAINAQCAIYKYSVLHLKWFMDPLL